MDGEYTIQSVDDISWNYTLEIYIILLTYVTPKFNKNKLMTYKITRKKQMEKF